VPLLDPALDPPVPGPPVEPPDVCPLVAPVPELPAVEALEPPELLALPEELGAHWQAP
jgi:hypothetical protein